MPDAAANLDSAVPQDVGPSTTVGTGPSSTELGAGPPAELEAGPARRTSLAERLGALGEVVLCSGFPTQLFLVTAMTAAGMEFRTPEGHWSPTFVSVLSLLDTAFVIGLIVLFLASHRERPRDVLIGTRNPWREAMVGLGLLPIVFVLAVLILAVLYLTLPGLHNVPKNPLEDMLQNRRDALMFGTVAIIAGGVREEIQRGFILHRFQHYLGGSVVGVVVYSAAFGLGHIDQGWDAAIAVASLGAIWGTIYTIRRSVIAPMVSHAGFNLAQVIKFVALR